MAYVFRKIQDLLGNEQQVKQDIFSPQATQAGGEQPPGGPQDNAPKTSTEGDLGARSSGETAATGGEGAPLDVKGVDPNLVKKNLGKTKAPRFAEQAQGNLSQAQTSLQNEANQYVQDYASKDYTIDTGTLDKAIGSDKDAYDVVGKRLGEQAGKATQFAPKTRYDFSDQLNEFKTDEGLKSILRRESGPQYSSGEAAFDVMLLNRNPEFQKIRSQLGDQQQGLVKQADDWRTSKTAEAQKALETQLGKGKEQVTGYLGAKEKEFIKAQQDQMAAENAELARLRGAGGGQYLSDQQRAVMEALRGEYAGTSPQGVSKYLDQAGINAGDFYGTRGDYDDYKTFIDQDEAKRFSNIYGLLGRSDDDAIRNSVAGSGAAARQGFDTAAFKNSVNQGAIEKNRLADEAANAEIDRILNEVRGRVAPKADAERFFQRNAIAEALKQQYRPEWDKVNVDANLYNRDIGELDLLNQSDIDRLSPLLAEAERTDAFSAGGGAGKAFDSDGYRAALESQLKALRDAVVNVTGAPGESSGAIAAASEATKTAGTETPFFNKIPTSTPGGVPGSGNTTGSKPIINIESILRRVKGSGPAKAANQQAKDIQKSAPVQAVIEAAANSPVGQAVSNAGEAIAKADPRKLCFPGGVRFKMEDGTLKKIEHIMYGDRLESGGEVTNVQRGDADDMFLVGTALVTGDHPVMLENGVWRRAKNVPGALPVSGKFYVYSVTCEEHRMIHEDGIVFGDFEADDLLGLGA